MVTASEWQVHRNYEASQIRTPTQVRITRAGGSLESGVLNSRSMRLVENSLFILRDVLFAALALELCHGQGLDAPMPMAPQRRTTRKL
jgi:hypothetical protein